MHNQRPAQVPHVFSPEHDAAACRPNNWGPDPPQRVRAVTVGQSPFGTANGGENPPRARVLPSGYIDATVRSVTYVALSPYHSVIAVDPATLYILRVAVCSSSVYSQKVV